MENLQPYLLPGSRIWSIDTKKERLLVNILSFAFVGGLVFCLFFLDTDSVVFLFSVLIIFILLSVALIIQSIVLTPKVNVFIEENGYLFQVQKSTGTGATAGGLLGGAIGAAIGSAIDNANAKNSVVTSPGVFGIATSGKAAVSQVMGVKILKEKQKTIKFAFSLALINKSGNFNKPMKRRLNISKQYYGFNDLLLLIHNIPPIN